MTESPRAGDEGGLIVAAVELARRLQQRALALQTPQERRQQAELDRMIQNPADKATLVQMTDQTFRSRAARRAADQLTHILDVQGVPRFFSPVDRTLLRGFQSFGGYLPGVAVPLVKEKMHQETANVVLPAEPQLLAAHLRARQEQGVRMNVNFLGEALLGEEEAERRLEGYLAALQNPDIEVVSVKISTIFSQISAVAREETIRTLCDRFELLVRAAAKERFTRADGTEVRKLVYLDMEEYRDLAITVETFLRTLDRPGLETAPAGIVLQAYLPDSFAAQRRITEWAMRRVAGGGAPTTLRLVKGANMEMERVEASLRGWPAAPFQTKRETDANYKRMLRFGLEPGHARAVRVGVASHNLFDLAYGLVLAEAREVREFVHLEMLEGMANHQRRALFEETSAGWTRTRVRATSSGTHFACRPTRRSGSSWSATSSRHPRRSPRWETSPGAGRTGGQPRPCPAPARSGLPSGTSPTPTSPCPITRPGRSRSSKPGRVVTGRTRWRFRWWWRDGRSRRAAPRARRAIPRVRAPSSPATRLGP